MNPPPKKKKATVNFLELHGWTSADARFKADHDLIFWASVHTAASEHQPHVTTDALLGGVFYVELGSGQPQLLQLFDPRGKMAAQLTADNAKELPRAPFHRVVSVEPSVGKLVIFPGWLVHSVAPKNATQLANASEEGIAAGPQRARVSLSVNLKGDWHLTSALTLEMEAQEQQN